MLDRYGARIRHGHVNHRVALILRLIPGAAAGIISVARIGIWRASARRQSVISRAVGSRRQPGDGANRDARPDGIVAPAVPTAATTASPVAIAITNVDVASIDVVVAAAARSLTGPSRTANTAHATDTAHATNATNAADATWAAGTANAANAADASWAAGTANAADSAGATWTSETASSSKSAWLRAGPAKTAGWPAVATAPAKPGSTATAAAKAASATHAARSAAAEAPTSAPAAAEPASPASATAEPAASAAASAAAAASTARVSLLDGEGR